MASPIACDVRRVCSDRTLLAAIRTNNAGVEGKKHRIVHLTSWFGVFDHQWLAMFDHMVKFIIGWTCGVRDVMSGAHDDGESRTHDCAILQDYDDCHDAPSTVEIPTLLAAQS